MAQAIAADVATRADTLVSKVVKERAEAADDARGRREKIADAAATAAAREALAEQSERRAREAADFAAVATSTELPPLLDTPGPPAPMLSN